MKLAHKLLGISVGVASLTLIAASQAEAAQIKTDGTWYGFNFGGEGSSATGCSGFCSWDTGGISEGAPEPDPSWDFVVNKGGAFLTIQDAFIGGDRFTAYSNGTLLGTTSTVPEEEAYCDNNLIACVSDPNISKGTFFLNAGSYSMNIFADLSPFGSGSAFFQVTQVPEPMTVLGTLAFGGLGAGSWLKRRKKTSK